MDNQDWALLSKLPDLISRGALINLLGEKQIEVYAPDRDVIVNVNPASPNLSLEGYSAIFDGYEVYVARKKLNDAKNIWEEFQKEMYKPSLIETDHPHKFYSMSVMSFFFPLVTHTLALYHLREGLRKGQKFSVIKVAFSILVLIPSAILGVFFLRHLLEVAGYPI